MKDRHKLPEKIALLISSFVLFIFTSEVILGLMGFNYYPVDIKVNIPEKDRVFRLNMTSGYYEIAKEKLSTYMGDLTYTFAYQKFKEVKDLGTYRIFILGGSSVWNLANDPYYNEYANEKFKFFYPNKELEIVFAGGGSHGTSTLYPILQEILEYKPDLIVLYSGHNEFLNFAEGKFYLEHRGIIDEINEKLEKFRIYQFLSKIIIPIKNSLNTGNRDMEIIDPSEWVGALNETHKQIVYENYRLNIEDMIRMAKNKNVNFVLSTVSYNHMSPPVSPHLVEDALKKLNTKKPEDVFGESAINFSREQIEEILNIITNQGNMEELNEYKLGLKYYEKGQFEKAREHFEKGLLLEDFPHRANSISNGVIRELAKEYNVPLADVEIAVLNATEHSITTYEYFDDHCHLNRRGNEILLDTFLKTIKEKKLVE